ILRKNYQEADIKNLIAHYFRAFCIKERPANLREMLQYGTFSGFVAGVMEPPLTIHDDEKRNVELMIGYNTGRTYRIMLDNRKQREIVH
ncbi:hypothetical protein HZA99_03220, partial [Candidatus Woesearchaeota archaeon]|nr:hypothetical protein [Candidatus Woesearchaeota archaeon]